MALTIPVDVSVRNMGTDGVSPRWILDFAPQCLQQPYLNRVPVGVVVQEISSSTGVVVDPSTYTESLTGTRLVLLFSAIPAEGVYNINCQLTFDPSS